MSYKPAAEVLKSPSIVEDVIIRNNKERILYIHRKAAEQDIYWFDNRSAGVNDAEVRLGSADASQWHYFF